MVEDIEWLFYEPYDQLMRQTLLAWQMVEHNEFGTVDWIHLHVVPEANVALRENTAAPNLRGTTMAEKWRSVLKQPDRYRLGTPTELVAGIGDIDGWKTWSHWLHDRYLS